MEAIKTEYEKSRILIVDDDKTNIDVLIHILKSEYTIFVAKTGEMAIKRAISDQPDLILLDIVMPDMSGYDVIKVLKEDDATRSIPVIFITGLSSVSDEERGFLLGAVDYIKKPFNNSIVKARIWTQIKTLKQIRAIERLGTIDALTELANRNYFEKTLASEWEKAKQDKKSISIISIDIDMLKQYNETYGHLQGDTLLQTMAKVFLNYKQSMECLVARVSGEEFTFILPDTELKEAVELARDIQHSVEILEIPSMGNLTTQITVSIGVAAKTPKSGEYSNSLFDEANKELLKAQEAGGNQICPVI